MTMWTPFMDLLPEAQHQLVHQVPSHLLWDVQWGMRILIQLMTMMWALKLDEAHMDSCDVLDRMWVMMMLWSNIFIKIAFLLIRGESIAFMVRFHPKFLCFCNCSILRMNHRVRHPLTF